MSVKPHTQWFPKGGVGQVVAQPGLYLQDNLGNLIITNTGNNLVPNPNYVKGKNKTVWTPVSHS